MTLQLSYCGPQDTRPHPRWSSSNQVLSLTALYPAELSPNSRSKRERDTQRKRGSEREWEKMEKSLDLIYCPCRCILSRCLANISLVDAVGILLFNPELLLTHLFTWPVQASSEWAWSASANNSLHYVVMLQESAIQIETNCYANLWPSSLSWPLFASKGALLRNIS